MSHLALTASFGSVARYHSGPKYVRVFGQLLVGGSGLYLFNNLEAPGATLRVRADESSVADALMAGFAVAESGIELDVGASDLAATIRASVPAAGDVELAGEDATLLAEAVGEVDVALLVTLNQSGEFLQAGDFRGWSVTVARTAT